MRRFVLTISVAEYSDKSIPELPGVRRDTEQLRRVLQAHAAGGVYRAPTLDDGNATKSSIVDAVKAIAEEAGVTDQVIIYLGGHGQRERDSSGKRWVYYFLPYDATFDRASANRLSMHELGELVSHIKASEVVLIFDSCHSGGIAGGFAWSADELNEICEGWRSVYVMAATRGREEAGEVDLGGFFMRELCAALEGRDVTRDADGRISAQAAWATASPRAEQEALVRGHRQTPVSFGPPAASIYLTRPIVAPPVPADALPAVGLRSRLRVSLVAFALTFVTFAVIGVVFWPTTGGTPVVRESSSVVADAGTTPILLAQSAQSADTPYEIDAAFYRVDGEKEQLLRPGSQIAPGDELFLKLQASVPINLYVVNEDENGEAFLLFPLPGARLTNPLSAGQRVTLPGDTYWRVTSAGGREHFLIFASPGPMEPFEQAFARLRVPTEGAPTAQAPLPPTTLDRLRGVGGLTPAPSRTDAATGLSRVFTTPLTNDREHAQGLWVRQITLDNPTR